MGDPTFAGQANPVPPEGVPYDPTKNMMQQIFNNDVSNGGTSYWVDNMLTRPFSSSDCSACLLTRGRALYMYTSTPGTLGFAGGYAYRERPTGNSQSMYTIAISGATLAEQTAQRVQTPSYFQTAFTATAANLGVTETKFITYNDVAVTDFTITNNGTASTTNTITATSPIATTPSADGTELTGSVSIRYALTMIFPRFSGDGFTVTGTNLTRSTPRSPRARSITLKVSSELVASELPDSLTEYAALSRI